MSWSIPLFRPAFFALTFAVGGVILLGSCAAPQSSPPANKAAANYASNSIATTAPNIENSEDQRPDESRSSAVSFDLVRRAFKDRLMRDSSSLLSKSDWEKDAWLDKNIGAFYKNDDEMVKAQVCDLTESALRSAKMKLKDWSRQRLYDSVNGFTKCKTAITLAYAATADAVRTNPVP